MNITIIAPNGFKIYFNLPTEKVEEWGNSLITMSHFDIGAITYDFRKFGGEQGNISETRTPTDC